MPYPTSIKEFVTKIDKNASGWFVSSEYFNVPSASPYEMYLDHVPRDTSTTIVGASGGAAWTLVTGTPGALQYTLDLDYGLVGFAAANADAAIGASYYSLGDDIMAEHVNTLQNEFIVVEGTLGVGVVGGSGSVKERLDGIDYTIADAITASGVNGTRITDNTVRAGALMNDIKGSTWVAAGRPVLTDITTHIDDSIDAHTADAISITPPGALTSVSVQEFISTGGEGTKSDENPHGTTWIDIYTSSGDLDVAAMDATFADAYVSELSSSGNYYPTASGAYNVGLPDRVFSSGCFDVVYGTSFQTGSQTGTTGQFTAGANTVTVQNGLIVSIV